MAIKVYRPTSQSRRHASILDPNRLTRKQPEKTLLLGVLKKAAGRNNYGKVTTRHRGGGAKQLLREVDWKRDKTNVPGQVVAIEYDPNRTSDLSLIHYADGAKRYILAPLGLKTGDTILSGPKATITTGHTLPLKNIPVGTPIHNLELTPGKGAQIIRSAGSQALIQSKENGFATVLLPSKEIRLIRWECIATIGQVGNPEHRTIKLGKAGRRRHQGWRPAVRGVAMHPDAHPHGGGEGRSGIGMPSPKSPWGKPTLGKKTRKYKKYSHKYIVKHRR